jgi:hypothetical protein
MAPHVYPYIQAIRTLALGSALAVLGTLLLYVSGLRYSSKKVRFSEVRRAYAPPRVTYIRIVAAPLSVAQSTP